MVMCKVIGCEQGNRNTTMILFYKKCEKITT